MLHNEEFISKVLTGLIPSDANYWGSDPVTPNRTPINFSPLKIFARSSDRSDVNPNSMEFEGSRSVKSAGGSSQRPRSLGNSSRKLHRKESLVQETFLGRGSKFSCLLRRASSRSTVNSEGSILCNTQLSPPGTYTRIVSKSHRKSSHYTTNAASKCLDTNPTNADYPDIIQSSPILPRTSHSEMEGSYNVPGRHDMVDKIFLTSDSISNMRDTHEILFETPYRVIQNYIFCAEQKRRASILEEEDNAPVCQSSDRSSHTDLTEISSLQFQSNVRKGTIENPFNDSRGADIIVESQGILEPESPICKLLDSESRAEVKVFTEKAERNRRTVSSLEVTFSFGPDRMKDLAKIVSGTSNRDKILQIKNALSIKPSGKKRGRPRKYDKPGRPPKKNAKAAKAEKIKPRSKGLSPPSSDFRLTESDDEYQPGKKSKLKKKVGRVAKGSVSRRAAKEKKRKLGPRSKTGCWTCRIRHKSCPENKPSCYQCLRLQLQCDYSEERPIYMKDPVLQAKKIKEIRDITDIHKKASLGRKKTKCN